MSEATTVPAAARHMREEAHPSWPEALERAALNAIAAAPGLREAREAALSSLRRVGLPGPGSEDFTFLRTSEFLGPLSAAPARWDAISAAEGGGEGARASAAETLTLPTPDLIRPLIFPESRDNYLVLLDGEYSPALSRPAAGIAVSSLEAGLGSGPSALPAARRAALLSALARETDAAAALAALFSPQPLLVRIAAQAAPSAPLQILHLGMSPSGPRQDVFLVIAAGRLSETRIVVRHAEADLGPGQARAVPMANIHSLLLLEEAAAVKWLESSPEGPGTDSALRFHKLGATLERDSRLFAAVATTGAKVSRHAYAVDLRGQGAEVELDGATVLAGARQAHHFAQVRHLAPRCASRQHFKTVAADRGRASVDGTIYVGEGAQLTDANQLINHLMLSDEARADSKPRLLIHADDVKCTHGATSGKLDPQQQFYLESRGLSAPEARALLTSAFIAEVVERADRALGASGASGPGSAASGFRAHLDATLLATLKRRLAGPGA